MEQFKVKLDDRYLVGFIGDHGIKTSGFFSDAVIFNISSSTSLTNDIIKRTSPNCIVEFIPVTTEKQPESKPKELDLCEILKDAPKGLKLWSVIHGEVEFEWIKTGGVNPIRITSAFIDKASVDCHGRVNPRGECTLFPSKENRDWSTFKLPYKLPVKGELCWTMSSVGNWIPRFATGYFNGNNADPLFFDDQTQKGSSNNYKWQPLSEVPEVLRMHLKLK